MAKGIETADGRRFMPMNTSIGGHFETMYDMLSSRAQPRDLLLRQQADSSTAPGSSPGFGRNNKHLGKSAFIGVHPRPSAVSQLTTQT